MTKLVRRPKLKGMIYADDPLHGLGGNVTDIAPNLVNTPSGTKVPQYAKTVVGTSTAYDPAGNCEGNFMSYKFQPNNNCYNYSTNYATNSFAQPGRMTQNNYHHVSIVLDEMGTLSATNDGSPTGSGIVAGAVSDGLINLGPGMAETSDEILIKPSDLLDKSPAEFFAKLRNESSEGVSHLVALLISEADESKGWPGDFHWVRCDDLATFTWSQKDGPDQITNFDFAGNPIDCNNPPHLANWTCNNGPTAPTPSDPQPVKGNDDIVSVYKFYTYMWVPSSGIKII
jgi:hypothetical protein